MYRFVGGELNACYNAVDRHVEGGKENKVALIHDSPVTNSIRKVTYGVLQQQVTEIFPLDHNFLFKLSLIEYLYFEQVSLLAGALAKLGVKKGDRVLIYMPLIPEAIIAMLATVRLGAIHSGVFGGK